MAEQEPKTRLGKLIRPNAPEAATSEQKLRRKGEGVRGTERDLGTTWGSTSEEGTTRNMFWGFVA